MTSGTSCRISGELRLSAMIRTSAMGFDPTLGPRRNPVCRVSTVEGDLRALRERLAVVFDLQRAGGVLGWDQRVTMPPGGGPARAEALATIGRLAHEKFIDDEIGALCERLRPYEESLEYDFVDASLIRVTRRDWEKMRRVPAELRAEM